MCRGLACTPGTHMHTQGACGWWWSCTHCIMGTHAFSAPDEILPITALYHFRHLFTYKFRDIHLRTFSSALRKTNKWTKKPLFSISTQNSACLPKSNTFVLLADVGFIAIFLCYFVVINVITFIYTMMVFFLLYGLICPRIRGYLVGIKYKIIAIF